MSDFVQRDLGAAAEASSGGGAAGMRSEFWVLMTLAGLLIVAVALTFAMAGELAVRFISPQKEAALFGGLKPQIEKLSTPANNLTREPLQRANAILTKLTQHESVPRMDFKLILLDEKDLNAFAFPGGVIGVTRGLLDALQDEVELAFVLAHEIGHSKNRDHLRRFFRDAGRSVALASLFGDASGVIHGLDQWVGMQYSQTQEHAADQFAVELVLATYGSVTGAERLFELLAKEESVTRWGHLFSTHPETQERIKRLRAFAKAAVLPNDDS
jgi:Zn-dependent protease with chaperone function